MSTWIEIKDIDDIEINPTDDNELEIQYSTDYNGANYISIPVDLIVKVLREGGVIQ